MAALLQKTNPHSPGIDEAYRRAIELNPSDAYVRQEYALYLLSATKQPNAAIGQILEAARLDPLSVRTRCYFAWILFSAGRFREAQEQVTRALALDPNFPFALYIQGHLFEHDRRLEAAVVQFQKAVNSSGRTPKYLFTLADAYLQAGRKGDARRILAELQQQSKTQYVAPDYLRRLSDQLGK